MSRIEPRRRALGVVGVSALAAGFALSLTIAAAAPSVADRYDAYVNATKNKPFSFGGDSDVKEALVEWGKAIVSNLPIPQEKQGLLAANLGESAVDAYEFWDDVDASIKKGAGGPTKDDVGQFMAKLLLHNVARSDPEDFAKVAHALCHNEEQAEKLIEIAPGFAQGGGEAGANLSDKQTVDAIKKIELAAIDEFCPACEVGRKTVLLGIAESKAVYAKVQDQIGDDEYQGWKQSGVDDARRNLDPGVRGYSVMMAQVRDIIVKSYADAGMPPPDDNYNKAVESFIKKKFESFAADEKTRNADADLLAAAKADYLKLSDVERAQFGATDDDRVARFSQDYLRIYKTMIGYKGKNDWPFGVGPDGFRAAVVDIVKNEKSISILDLRQRIAADLVRWGWLKPTTAGPVEISRVRDRLATLDYFKMKALFDYMDIALPKDFYVCMCAQNGHTTGSGVGYNPDACPNTGCQFTGNLGGQYCAPMPTDAGAFAACAPKAALAGGKPLDQYIAEELAKGKH
jgi:hypothetical protein